jgi:hypothetical protein
MQGISCANCEKSKRNAEMKKMAITIELGGETRREKNILRFEIIASHHLAFISTHAMVFSQST